MTTKHALFHFQTAQALSDLADTEKSVRLRLMKGKAAGKLDLIHQLYPPKGIHRYQIPARYTFVLDEYVTNRFPIRVTQELLLMVSLVDTCDGGDGLIFGYIAHDYWMDIESPYRFVAVKYNPVNREGFVHLYKEAYVVLEGLNKDDLDRVRQPRAAAERKAVEASKPKQKRQLPKAPEVAPRILYAEDGEDLRGGTEANLCRWGYAVTTVEDGQQLMGRLLVEPAFDLVVTDNEMPNMSGLQVLRKIREDHRFKDLPVIVFSGDKTIKAAVEKAGAAFLEKGKADPDDLNDLIKKMLARAS